MLPAISSSDSVSGDEEGALSSSLLCPSFEYFVLHKVSKNPRLIAETPSSVFDTLKSTDHGATASLLERYKLIPKKKSESSAEEIAIIQRALVDYPLLPLGGEQLLYKTLLPPFALCISSSRLIYELRSKIAAITGKNELGQLDSLGSVAEEEKKDSLAAKKETKEVLMKELHDEEEKLLLNKKLLAQAYEKIKKMIYSISETVSVNQEDDFVEEMEKVEKELGSVRSIAFGEHAKSSLIGVKREREEIP